MKNLYWISKMTTHLPTRKKKQQQKVPTQRTGRSICSSSIYCSNTRALLGAFEFSRLTRIFRWQVDGKRNWRFLKFQLILSISFLKQWVGIEELITFVFALFQAKYIAQCIEEIKLELRQDNMNVKCNAVAKLTYVSTKYETFSKQTFSGWMGFWYWATNHLWFLVSMINLWGNMKCLVALV